MNLARQEVGHRSRLLGELTGFPDLGCVHAFSGEGPALFALPDGALVDAIDDPGIAVVMGQVVLAGFLDRCHDLPTVAGMTRHFV